MEEVVNLVTIDVALDLVKPFANVDMDKMFEILWIYNI